MYGEEVMPYNEQLPGRLSPNFGSFSLGDLLFTVCMASITIVLWTKFGILVAPITPILWFALMSRRTTGHTYRPYYYILAKLASWWLVKVKHGNIRTAGEPTVDETAGDKAAEGKSTHRHRERSSGSSAVPFTASYVPADLEGETIGLAHNKKRRTDSFVIVGDGSDLVGSSLAQQCVFLDSMAETAAQVVSMHRGYSVGVSFLFRKDPFDVPKLMANMESFLHEEIFLPSSLEVPVEELTPTQIRMTLSALVWQQLQQEVIPAYGRKVWMATVVTVRREGVLAKAQKTRSIEPGSVRRLAITKMVKTFVAGLESAGVTNPRPLDRGEIHDMIRGAWDVETIHDYYNQAVTDPDARYKDGFIGHWPSKHMQVGHAFSNTDGTVTTVLRLTGNRSEEWQGYWRELIAGIESPYASVALVGSVVRGKFELAFLERATAWLEAILEAIGFSSRSLAMQQRQTKLDERRHALFKSGFSQSWSILTALRGVPMDELDEAVDQVEALGTRKGMTMSQEGLAIEQYNSLWEATLAIPMS